MQYGNLTGWKMYC